MISVELVLRIRMSWKGTYQIQVTRWVGIFNCAEASSGFLKIEVGSETVVHHEVE